MKQLIVHVGLPKTATTTLQHHVFQELHEQGRLNFLGKAVSLEARGAAPKSSNYRGADIRRACQETIPQDISRRIDQMLVDDRLNVFSDEGILTYYPGQENVPLERRIANLKALLAPFDIKILLTLRNPLDLFFSLYIQLYPECYRRLASLDSFEKCAADLLNKGVANIRYEFFDLERLLSLMVTRFDTTVLLYEDMTREPDRFAQALADLLGVEADYLVKQLSSHWVNRKPRSVGHVYSEEVTRLKTRLRRLERLVATIAPLHRFARKAYSKNVLGIRRILEQPRRRGMKEHSQPDSQLKHRLQETLCIKDPRLFEAHGLDRRRLEAYGYLSREHQGATAPFSTE
ncbi:sulfotransferase domain-containing protein [Halomonas cerina]|uniref:Sulfotransferase domain-containing protein n=1 Tax=Halomonas cerina TaxID=447424 RepID=A0A839V1C4_9GAMM|nr:sulfotransferase domain-containing protein [Halomonas cerina]MBB3189543.1 hypothetical protein [Halomonas cerina]